MKTSAGIPDKTVAAPLRSAAGSPSSRSMKSQPEKKRDSHDYRRVLDDGITATLRQAAKIVMADPSLLFFAARTIISQKEAAARRCRFDRQGICVPAAMIVSITRRCNLSCKGCYMRGRHQEPAPEMSPDQLASVIGQAGDLGVSFVVFAGGEPLVRKDEILALAQKFPKIIFAVFSNGLLIDEKTTAALAERKNIIPVLSFEGFEKETDNRRGEGVYRKLMRASAMLEEHHIFFGCSVTVTRSNHALVTDEKFVRMMIDSGCRIFTFVEYVPIQPGTEGLVLTGAQRENLAKCLNAFNTRLPAVFIGFPGDEEKFGGCLSAGRGFVHVSAAGSLEPCPAAPFSDADLTKVSLKEALQSDFLRRIRENHAMLTETDGGCALWTNRKWTSSLLRVHDLP
ncbi:MAG: radical SAM protein [Methanoregula sp.]|nr:MAG: radical SAM protein [Methanoregula sp.]